MSVRTILTQKSRPYKIEIYGLQDDFLGTLQSYNDTFIGQVKEPEISIQDDGSQTFTCSIPKFYIDPKTNNKIQNPRWLDIDNGILAENTRILKVFLKIDNETKVYPFIIDKITDKRDSHFSVYREIEANGLAFAELGKVGYKLELNSHTLETDYAKDNTTVATINYWLDKVFPNERNSSGKVTKWLTPWCYEIRMDWAHYTEESREPTKVYEDSYISSWGIQESGSSDIADSLVAKEITAGREKARYIDCHNSNKYNITQDIAQAFEVFCTYEYECGPNGKFIKEYTDKNGKVWQGRKVVFYNRAIKTDNPLVIDYEHNLQSISRTSDSSEIYTKLYVSPIESATMETGYISIADANINPLLDDFILDFDYLYNIGSISDYQKNFINNYEVSLHKINTQLINLAPTIESLTVDVNNVKADIASIEKSISSAQEQLQTYQKLRDNEVTNTPVIKDKANPYSIIFVPSNDVTQAQIRLQGVAAPTIVGYSDFGYTNKVFEADDLKIVNKVNPVIEGDNSFYLVLDDYGYPSIIYTSVANTNLKNGSGIFYLSLTYSPKNAYESICDSLQNSIDKNIVQKELLEKSLKNEEDNTGLEIELEAAISLQEELLQKKEQLNQKLELVLGPALREGYWTPESYEDPGEGVEATLTIQSSWEKTGAKLIFDTEMFDGEEKGYYYDSVDSINADEKKYHNYIDISSYYSAWRNYPIENLTIHLLNPKFIYEVSGKPFPIGKYFVIYNGKRNYFATTREYPVGTKLEIKNVRGILYLYANGSSVTSMSTTVIDGATNITTLFEGINSYLGDRLLYNNAGFVFAFIEKGGSVIPVLLLNNTSIDYSRYQDIGYSFPNVNMGLFSKDIEGGGTNEIKLRYPRIAIYNNNVNYDSDNLTIVPNPTNDAALPLEKYKDYSILLRNSKPFFTLKVTNNNNIYTILKSSYKINYQISRANETLYLDAKQVAKDNSQPKYSYELSIANTPEQVEFLELGQLTYINDYSLGLHAITGYISEIKYKLDEPQNDQITIQNYKTKFEDLFSTITASSEAMKNNAVAYDIAAGSFNSKGELSGNVLQDSINNNNISFSFSNTNVNINDTEGIILTNTTAYTNGVYGQVALRGGGVFLSNAVDSTGARIWNTGITPEGINASTITTGQLDTNLIRVFAGDNLAFQWNGEGIFAYRRNEDGTTDLNSYVKYSDKGLQYLIGDEASVDLGWNGLVLNAQNGSLSLTGSDGLTIYEGQKNENGTNHVVRLGRFTEDDGSYEYGLRLYKKDTDDTYKETLITTNSGELWLKDEIIVGTAAQSEDGSYNIAGITGTKNAATDNKSVRFWAGSLSDDKNNAPFQVLQDGTLIAKRGKIGSLTIESVEEDISNLSVSVNITSSKGEIFSESAGPQTTLNVSIIKSGGEISDLSTYSFAWQKKKSDESAWINFSATAETRILMEDSLQIRCIASQNGNKYYSNIITFKQIYIDDSQTSYRVAATSATLERGLKGYYPSSINVTAFKDENLITFDTKTENSYPMVSGENIQLTLSTSDDFGNVNQISADAWEFSKILDESGNYTGVDDLTTIVLSTTDAYLSSSIDRIILQLMINGKMVAYKEVLIVLDEQMKEIAKIDQNGQVIIGDGKVYSSAIIAGSIISEKIATGAIETQHFKSSQIESTDAFSYQDSVLRTYAGSGSLINLNGAGSLHFKNFYIDQNGNAGIRGTIEALSGLIGGWTVEEQYIAKINDSKQKLVGLYSGETLTYNDSPIRFFAGGTNSLQRNFIVTEDGQLFARNANITGTIVAEDGYINNKFYVGKNHEITLNGLDGSMYSHGYAPNVSGWKISQDGSAEFNNIAARGKLSSVVFETNKTSCVGGTLYIAPTIIFQEDVTVDSNNRFTLSNATNDLTYWPIGSSGYLNCTVSSFNKEYTNIAVSVISNDSNNIVFEILQEQLQNSTITAGSNIIFMGSDTTKKYIYLNAVDANGPFMDVQNYTSSSQTNVLPQVRIGNLEGIIDEYFSKTSLSGYGLYSQNAYLRGQMILPKVGITNQESIGYNGQGTYNPVSDEQSIGSSVRIWAGGEYPIAGEAAAPFIVTQDGSLYATKGIFSGIIQATGGFFSGSIKTAGVVIDDHKTEDKESEYDHFYVAYREGENVNKNDYVLNIDKNGLSIYENGLSVYSDLASGWNNDTLDNNYIYAPYNYNSEKYLPYFYFKDEIQINDAKKLMNSRWISTGGHIFNIENISGDQYKYNSISFNNGVLFDSGVFSLKDDSLEKIEETSYQAQVLTGLKLQKTTGTMSQSFLNIIGENIGFNIPDSQESLEEDFVFNGNVQIINTNNSDNNSLLLNKQYIKEAIYNNGSEQISCGIDIITIK